MRRVLGLLALFALGAGERMVEPAHGTVVLQGLNFEWARGPSRVRSLSAGVSATSPDPATPPKGEAALGAVVSADEPTRAGLRYAALSTPRPVMRGSETLTLHGHRDKDPYKRQPAVRTNTVLVELPEGAPPNAVVWLSGINLELGAAHPSGLALQAFGVTTSAPVVEQHHARFELTVTLESGEGASGVPDPVDYDATVTVDWALVPAEAAALGRIDLMPEDPLGAPWPLSWSAPQGSAGVLAGLSGFSFALDDKVVARRHTLQQMVVELGAGAYDPALRRWSGELALNLVSRLEDGKTAPAYGQGTVSLLALGAGDTLNPGAWTLPTGVSALRAPYPFGG